MKMVANKVNRSGVYYLMTTIASANETRSARSDTWGAVAVVILLLGSGGPDATGFDGVMPDAGEGLPDFSLRDRRPACSCRP